jgi:Leucine-rich repeat (LRR) protein
VSSLGSIYNETGGDNWFDNTGWMSDLHHCEWFGISCNGEGYVTKVELSNNNLVGKFPADFIASFYKLQVLDLSSNKLSGAVAGEYEWAYLSWNETSEWWDQGPGPDTTIFFNLRELVRVDLSQNKLSGEVDILFAPALEHANFSHNNFTSIDSFKVRACYYLCCRSAT